MFYEIVVGLNQGDEEDDCFVVEEDGTLIYTRFCSKRAASLLNKKELCHICYFKHGRVNPFKKTEVFLSSILQISCVFRIDFFMHICYTFNNWRNIVGLLMTKMRAKKVDIYVRRKVVVSRHLQGKRPVDTTTSAMRNIGVISVAAQLLLSFFFFQTNPLIVFSFLDWWVECLKLHGEM